MHEPPRLPVAATPAKRQPRIWQFWGTALWGLFILASILIVPMAGILYSILTLGHAGQILLAIPVLLGLYPFLLIACLPVVFCALWLAIRPTDTLFSKYLALRLPSSKNLAIGVIGLVVIVIGWTLLSRATGRAGPRGFVLATGGSAHAHLGLLLDIAAFCVAAPVWEELFARGFLYRGWSESFLKVPGAILLSSLVWTGLHLRQDWFFFGEVFSIGLLLGYLRYRSGSTWLTIIVHGLNNLGALTQSMLFAGST
jgi:membrane protease YdiL (CAAX protease family)